MDLKQIRELIELMQENQIAEIDLEQDGERLRIVASSGIAPVISTGPQLLGPVPVIPEEELAAHAPKEEEAEKHVTIKSPMVGTFYRAPSSDSPSYIDEGDEVDEDTVVCIVEAMKVMNEIKAETRGRILEVLVENGQPVEFGQPLFSLLPAG